MRRYLLACKCGMIASSCLRSNEQTALWQGTRRHERLIPSSAMRSSQPASDAIMTRSPGPTPGVRRFLESRRRAHFASPPPKPSGQSIDVTIPEVPARATGSGYPTRSSTNCEAATATSTIASGVRRRPGSDGAISVEFIYRSCSSERCKIARPARAAILQRRDGPRSRKPANSSAELADALRLKAISTLVAAPARR